jgi:aspartate/methionine/tyrosine aminotransferase
MKHLFKGVNAIEVSRRLAMDAGVVTLPAEFFCREVVTRKNTGSLAKNIAGPSENDMWIRFSVANVDDAKLRKVCERLAESETSLGWELESMPKI